MGFRIEFRVDDIPPKKDGANSIWGKDTEAPRIISLRKKAFEGMKKQGLSCISSRVSLAISLHVPSYQLESIGDLDNFIGGVCDGLQKADARARIHEQFKAFAGQKIHPSYSLLENDSRIMSIIAQKAKLEPKEEVRSYYTVVIEEI
jgi:hypothetical protein